MIEVDIDQEHGTYTKVTPKHDCLTIQGSHEAYKGMGHLRSKRSLYCVID